MSVEENKPARLHIDLTSANEPAKERLGEMMENIKRSRAAMGASLLGVGEAVSSVSISLAEFNKAIRGGEDVNDVKAAMKCSQPPIGCGADLGPDYQFRDLTSAREYQITALCQSCQDLAFAPWDEEEVEAERAAQFEAIADGMGGDQSSESPF